MRPLVAFVSLYRDGVKVFETAPLTPHDGWNPATEKGGVPFHHPARRIDGRRLQLQVTVLDPEGKRDAFWRAPITVTPE